MDHVQKIQNNSNSKGLVKDPKSEKLGVRPKVTFYIVIEGNKVSNKGKTDPVDPYYWTIA